MMVSRPDDHTVSRIEKNAPWQWMKANNLPDRIPDDAYLAVDEDAGTITVEVWALNDAGQIMFHGHDGAMTTMATFPLKVPPPPGLLDAYQHSLRRIRRQRDAATAIRYEVADTLIEQLGLNPAQVFEALDLPVPTARLQELP